MPRITHPIMLLTLALLITLASLGCKDRAQPRVEPDPELKLDGGKQLGSLVSPLDYTLHLKIDPAQERFEGHTIIRIRVTQPTRVITLHGEDFTVGQIRLGDQSGRAITGEHGALAVVFDTPVEPGEHRLEVVYSAPLKETPNGLYRVKEGEDWYAFTQFEPLAARKAFPSFDEPRFKTPYSVTITAPTGLEVAANSQRQGMSEEGALTTHTFKTTQPLPTYLVAFAVGPFDVVDAPPEVNAVVPMRVLATKGRGELASFALSETPKILEILTDYFDQPYPFDKLDLVAVPNFSAGAMENVGLVTFRESLLLLDPKQAAPAQRYAVLSVIAHELAHMWFGNLVTPGWWDELWLNESFATWMEVTTLHELDPTLEPGLRQLQRVSRVMSADSMSQTRAIRQPIRSVGDIHNAFDGITYGKGAAVLHMLETYLGPEAFRDGIRQVMRDHAYGTLTTDRLIAGLQAHTDKPVAPILASFIDQPGVPLLKIATTCGADQVTQLTITQERYLPAGSGAAKTGPWQVPLCVKFGVQGQVSSRCELLTGAEQTIKLPARGCAEWLYPNAEETGYYRWSLPTPELLALLGAHRKELSTREQLAMLGHLNALVEAQQVDPLDAFRAARALLDSENSQIISQAADTLLGAQRLAKRLGLEREFAELLVAALKPHVERLGLEPVAGELPAVGTLRGKLLGILADEGMDPWLVANAKSLVPAFVQAPDQFPAHRQWALMVAASQADALLWEELRATLDRTRTPAGRGMTLRALGHVRDPALLRRTLDLYFEDAIRSAELWSLVWPSLGDERLASEVTLPWLMERHDALRAKLGDEDAESLPYFASTLCDAESRERVGAFFGDPARQVPGTARNLSQALESVDRCIAITAYQRDAVSTLLGAKSP